MAGLVANQLLPRSAEGGPSDGLNWLCLIGGAENRTQDRSRHRTRPSRWPFTSQAFLIIDLFLPVRSGDAPDKLGGMNLLTELRLSSRFFKPDHVLALTGFSALRAEFEAKFNEGPWSIDLYDPSDIGWRNRLLAKTKYILECARTSPTFETDLRVVAALPSPELDAVRSLEWSWSDPTQFDDVSYKYNGTFGKGRKVAAVSAPRMGMVAAACLATKLVMSLRPRVLVMTGICAGLRGECEIGDVVLGDPVWDWQMGKYTLDAFEIAPDQIGVSPEISQKVALLKTDVATLTKLWSESPFEKPQTVPRIHIGPSASGSSVLARAETAEAVRVQHRKTTTVDMELYGVYSAVRDISRPRPMAFGLKGVCDHADQYKNDKFQKHASYMSARVLEQFVCRFERELFG